MMLAKSYPIISAVAFAMLLVASSPTVGLADITVNDARDTTRVGDGKCTLREAINNANGDTDTTSGDCDAGDGFDTIRFTPGLTITLGSQLPNITDGLNVDGTGQGITISGGDAVRLFRVPGPYTLGLTELALVNGNSAPDPTSCFFECDGGALEVVEGTANVSRCTFSGNNGFRGGAIAVWGEGKLNLTDSTLDRNTALIAGGAVSISSSSLTFQSSAYITNSTFFENTGGNGGAIYSHGEVWITNCTVVDNVTSVGGQITLTDGLAVIKNTVLSAQVPGNCAAFAGTLAVAPTSVSDDATCASATRKPDEEINLDPNGPQDNGGPTNTIKFLSPSALQDTGDVGTCADPVGEIYRGAGGADQRGEARPAQGCDIGAFELQADEPSPSCPSMPLTGCKAAEPEKGALSFRVKVGDPGKSSLNWKWKGDAPDVSELGNPLSGTGYHVCLYDSTNSPFLDMPIAPGGTCDTKHTKPCWKGSAKGFQYRNKATTPEGIGSFAVKSGGAGKAAIELKATGTNLTAPSLPLAVPVIAQVSNGITCWSATFTTPTGDLLSGTKWKAKND